MATLGTQGITFPSSPAPTFSAASAGGDKAQPGDRNRLLVKNGSGASINVTLTVYPTTTDYGAATPALVVAVPAGGERWIGPLTGSRFTNPADGLVNITYSAATSVTVAVISD